MSRIFCDNSSITGTVLIEVISELPIKWEKTTPIRHRFTQKPLDMGLLRNKKKACNGEFTNLQNRRFRS